MWEVIIWPRAVGHAQGAWPQLTFTTLNYSAHVLSVPERSMTEHTVLDFDSADWTYKNLP